ncbi:MAG: ComF family protein [Bacilli bacterium]|nr:ComF family protein [Bacilli bacterium]
MKTVSQQLSNPTSICKNCFSDIDTTNIYSLVNKNASLCKKCVTLFDPKFRRFKVDGISAISLYDYDEFMKDLIFKLKGCFDYELKDVFLETYKRELSLLFKGYTMIPAPSYIEDDKIRGFNHVIEIFKSLKLRMLPAFEKTEHFKQSDHNFKERKRIKDVIKMKDDIQIPDKVLLVDDIYTTGSTMRTMISALKEKGIKKIKVLVLCKTQLVEKASNN